MKKKRIAEILEEIALLLELKGANPFHARAYRNAAHSLYNLDEKLENIIERDELLLIPGVGKDIGSKIETLVKTGKLPFYNRLKRSIEPALLELITVRGLGAKKAKILNKRLKINSIKDLKKAIKDGRVAKLRGFGEKTAENILESIENKARSHERRLWWQAIAISKPILAGILKHKDVKRAESAGSLRRKEETVGDLDFVVSASNPKAVIKWFSSQDYVDKVLEKTATKVTVRLYNGIMADVTVVPSSQFESALLFHTGSKDHNLSLAELANKQGLILNEHGLKSIKTDVIVHPASEREIYEKLGLQYIPPELREDRGELQAAKKGRLPLLIEESDIRGTFHNHTSVSDGRNTLLEMVQGAENLGWEFIGIADHSQSSFFANGLSEQQLLKQLDQIKRINRSKKFGVHVFSGTECDILVDGRLDFPDNLLKKLDYVVVSVHSNFKQDEKTMTKRIIRAIEHPYTTMIGHLTGRLLLRRDPYLVNVEKVIDACIANGKIMELNCNPPRLDMDWRYWHKAADRGLMCAINTDAHSVANLEYYKAGINVARKGWLEKENVVNTLPLKKLKQLLLKIKRG